MNSPISITIQAAKRKKVLFYDDVGNAIPAPIITEVDEQRSAVKEMIEANTSAVNSDISSANTVEHSEVRLNIEKTLCELNQMLNLSSMVRKKEYVALQACKQETISSKEQSILVTQRVFLRRGIINKASTILRNGISESENVIQSRRAFSNGCLSLRKNWRLILYRPVSYPPTKVLGNNTLRNRPHILITSKDIIAIDCSYASSGDSLSNLDDHCVPLSMDLVKGFKIPPFAETRPLVTLNFTLLTKQNDILASYNSIDSYTNPYSSTNENSNNIFEINQFCHKKQHDIICRHIFRFLLKDCSIFREEDSWCIQQWLQQELPKLPQFNITSSNSPTLNYEDLLRNTNSGIKLAIELVERSKIIISISKALSLSIELVINTDDSYKTLPKEDINIINTSINNNSNQNISNSNSSNCNIEKEMDVIDDTKKQIKKESNDFTTTTTNDNNNIFDSINTINTTNKSTTNCNGFHTNSDTHNNGIKINNSKNSNDNNNNNSMAQNQFQIFLKLCFLHLQQLYFKIILKQKSSSGSSSSSSSNETIKNPSTTSTNKIILDLSSWKSQYQIKSDLTTGLLVSLKDILTWHLLDHSLSLSLSHIEKFAKLYQLYYIKLQVPILPKILAKQTLVNYYLWDRTIFITLTHFGFQIEELAPFDTLDPNSNSYYYNNNNNNSSSSSSGSGSNDIATEMCIESNSLNDDNKSNNNGSNSSSSNIRCNGIISNEFPKANDIWKDVFKRHGHATEMIHHNIADTTNNILLIMLSSILCHFLSTLCDQLVAEGIDLSDFEVIQISPSSYRCTFRLQVLLYIRIDNNSNNSQHNKIFPQFLLSSKNERILDTLEELSCNGELMKIQRRELGMNYYAMIPSLEKCTLVVVKLSMPFQDILLE